VPVQTPDPPENQRRPDVIRVRVKTRAGDLPESDSIEDGRVAVVACPERHHRGQVDDLGGAVGVAQAGGTRLVAVGGVNG
jgi:hypothetical protein